MDTDTTQKSQFPSSLQIEADRCEQDAFIDPFGQCWHCTSPWTWELELSRIPFTSINKRRSLKADPCSSSTEQLQTCLQSQQASCNSCCFSFKLKRSSPLPGACAIHHLHASALVLLFLPDTCICACPSHFLSVLVSIKAFWRNRARVYLSSLLIFLFQFLHVSASCSPSAYTELVPEVICQLTPYPVLHL